MTTRPLVVITIAFAAGIATGYESSWPLTFLGLVAGLAGVAAALVWSEGSQGLAGSRKGAGAGWENAASPEHGSEEPGEKRKAGAGYRSLTAPLGDIPMAPALLVALFFFLGAAWARVDAASRQSTLRDDLHTHLYLTGRVAEEPKVYANRAVYVLEAWEARQENWRETLKEKVELVVYRPVERMANAAPYPIYRYGDILQVCGQLKLPPTARNPGEFDYRAYLARRGIFIRMSVEPANVRLLGHRPRSLITEWVYGVKARALAVIESSLPAREAGTLAAVLFGDQERLDEQDIEVYRTLGTYHVFAVSGSQVGFVLFLALVASRLLGGAPVVQLALGGLLILFYMALTGFTASVTRAGVMALVGLVALAREERADSYTALAAATLAILLWRPYELLEPGLQLSLAATWGIIYLNPVLEEMLSALPPWRRYLTVTLAAQAGVAWLIACYFNLFSLGAVPANLIVLPVIGAVTILGLLLVPLAPMWPGMAVALAWTSGGLLYGLSAALGGLAQVKGLALAVPRPPAWSAALYFGGLILAVEAWRYRRSLPWGRLRPALAGAALALLTLILCSPSGTDRLEVVFLDVGQGDAIYLRTPGGRHLLIDAGGPTEGGDQTFDPGARVVLPFLQRRGVRHLDLVISTHPHSDHLQGLFSVLEKIPASLVLLPPRSYFGSCYEAFIGFLTQRHLPYREATRGDRIWVDPEVELVVLNPPAPGDNPGAAPEWTENDYSLVVKCTYGETSFLLTGDIQAAAMKHLRQAEPHGGLPAGLRSTVFKVPHHGSANGLAQDFLAAVNPQVVVISVGEGNNFGHPSPEVVAFWRDRSVPLYRTDKHGAVTFRSNGRQIWPTVQVQPPKFVLTPACEKPTDGFGARFSGEAFFNN